MRLAIVTIFLDETISAKGNPSGGRGGGSGRGGDARTEEEERES
jgi:hypothetical protein